MTHLLLALRAARGLGSITLVVLEGDIHYELRAARGLGSITLQHAALLSHRRLRAARGLGSITLKAHLNWFDL